MVTLTSTEMARFFICRLVKKFDDDMRGEKTMSIANQDIRREIKTNLFNYWQIAERYGCADATFSRKLRKELPPQEKTKIREIIAELKKEAG